MGKDDYNVNIEGKSLDQLRELYKQQEKTLIEENKKHLAIVAHDIKNPMSSIIGFLGLILDRINSLDKKELEEYIRIALVSAEKTHVLLENLLGWAMSENANKSFNPLPLDIQLLLAEEINNIEILASQKKISIHIPVSTREKVLADVFMIKSVLRNLLSNAIKYSHENGRIDISTLRNNGFLEISIKDYGIGIKGETVNEIFSSGNKVSTLGTGDESGTGFGLLLCKEFIDMHNGKIWINSKPGDGSEFIFSLPVSN
ncbi:MAG: sensor histidine kinase [Bacteroidota bacterium]